jgi:hypothetical protein
MQMRQLAGGAVRDVRSRFRGNRAIIVNDTSNGAVTHVGVAMTFGLVVQALIYSLGDVSGQT